MLEIKKVLERKGYKVILPSTLEIFDGKTINELVEEGIVSNKKLFFRIIEQYFFKEIESSNAILVVNLEKDRYKGYIGPKTFAEMLYTYALGKKIYALREIDVDFFKKELEIIDYKIIGDKLENIKFF